MLDQHHLPAWSVAVHISSAMATHLSADVARLAVIYAPIHPLDVVADAALRV